MTRKNQHSDEKKDVFKKIQERMRNYALHHIGVIDQRTSVSLRNIDLIDDSDKPAGADIDPDVLRNPEHPLRVKFPPGPLFLCQVDKDKENNMAVEYSVLLYSTLIEVRKSVLLNLERMIDDGSLAVTPKTKTVFEKTKQRLLSEKPHEWSSSAVELSDALCDDVLVALSGVRQSLASDPPVQSGIDIFARRLFHPSIESLDSIEFEARKPEQEHARLTEVINSILNKAENLTDACALYYKKLGYLPLAPSYSLGEIVFRWKEQHIDADVWTEIWNWAQGESGPIPTYHACSVFVLHPDLIPDGRLPDLWQEILKVALEPMKKEGENVEAAPWALRRDLARHYAYHLEANLPDHDSDNIYSFAWWFAEQVAKLFPDNPESAQAYRENWIKPTLKRSVDIRLNASSRMAKSFLKYVTCMMSAPWTTALLALMVDKLEQLEPQNQPTETQSLITRALVSSLISAFPVAVKQPDDPTFAIECALGEFARKWAIYQPDEQGKMLQQLLEKSEKLAGVEGLCSELRNLTDGPLNDQIAVAITLQAKAYTDPAVADSVWDVLSDPEWRKKTLGVIDEPVTGRVMEALSIIQADKQDKWFYQLPHFIAELCETTEDTERRRNLFIYTIHTSLVSDTVSAIRRLLRGEQKGKFTGFVKAYRENLEGNIQEYPPWVRGRLRGLLATLHVI